MHAVDALESEVEQVLGDRFVGGDHQVLDDLVSRERVAGHDIGRIAPLVEQDLRLRDLEVEGAFLEAPPAQQPRGLDAVLHHPGYRLGKGVRGPVDPGLHLGVGEAGGAADQGGVDLDAAAPAVPVDHHLAGHGQPRFPGKERAQPVRQPLRQHRQDAPRKVDAGAAQQRLAVEGAARLHIPGDVGNRHPYPVAIPLLLGRHRIVEVPGILPVDGDVGARAQVAASSPGQRFFRVDLGEGAGLCQRFLREGAGQPEAVDGFAEIGGVGGRFRRGLPATG